MGYTKAVRRELQKACDLPKHAKGRDVMDLGAQVYQVGPQRTKPAREMFEEFGVDSYTSIDQNGKFGALKLDLSGKMPSHVRQYDLVMDMGTMEHVERQTPAWDNVFRMTKPGGYQVHFVPAAWYMNQTFQAGVWFYYPRFIDDLVGRYGLVKIHEAIFRWRPGLDLMFWILRRTPHSQIGNDVLRHMRRARHGLEPRYMR